MSNPAFAAVGLVLVGILLLAGAAIADAGYQTVGTPTDVENESFTPSTASFVGLGNSSNANLTYSRTVTVRDENLNSTIEGEDYEWNDSDATIRAIGGGELDGDSTAFINYTYYDPYQQQDDVLGAITTFIDVSQFWPLVILLALLFIALNVLGSV